jgi:hypothetical protein
MKVWDPNEALQGLTDATSGIIKDTSLDDPTQVGNMVQGIFAQHAAQVALGVVHIALHEQNARVRFQAQQYVLDRATVVGGEGGDPLTKLVEELVGLASAGS